MLLILLPLVMILEIFGFDVKALLAGAGILGLAVGLVHKVW